MRLNRGSRDSVAAAGLARLIAAEADPARDYHLMEFCSGHTLAILRYGVQDLLPANVHLSHGPGCPMCIVPLPRLDAAIDVAIRPEVIFASGWDMMRVPASRRRSLLSARARGADIRVIFSALEALDLALAAPGREVVFFAIGFETSTPATAQLILAARRLHVANLSVYCNHVLTPAALEALLNGHPASTGDPFLTGVLPAGEPSVRIDGFIAPSHVSALIGSEPFERVARVHRKPVVIAGFEPLEVLQTVHMLLAQLNAGRTDVEYQLTRGVNRDCNRKAHALMAEVFELRPSFEWRGLGRLPSSALAIRSAYADLDAERRFVMKETEVPENAACECPSIIRGLKKPTDCRIIGTICTPLSPIGSCMGSSEGVCAAYYNYRSRRAEATA